MNLLNFNFHLNGLIVNEQRKKLQNYCAVPVFVVAIVVIVIIDVWLTQRDERVIFVQTYARSRWWRKKIGTKNIIKKAREKSD